MRKKRLSRPARFVITANFERWQSVFGWLQAVPLISCVCPRSVLMSGVERKLMMRLAHPFPLGRTEGWASGRAGNPRLLLQELVGHAPPAVLPVLADHLCEQRE